MHAHRPDIRLSANNGDKRKADGVWAAIGGQLKPVLSSMRQPAVVDEHAGATGLDHDRRGLHHRACRVERTARTAQGCIHGVAIDRRQFLVGGRPAARNAKDLGKLIVGIEKTGVEALAIRQGQRRGRQAAAFRQTLEPLARVRPRARNAQIDNDRRGGIIHHENP